MTPEIAQLIRVSHRLSQAGGYLELGMTQHALDCLEDLGPLGPFEGEVGLLRAEALRRRDRYQDAALAVESAAKTIRSPQDKSTWLSLGACFEQAGNHSKALQMLARARGANSTKKG